jgi:membrane protein YdbS with pleckstrin-like domain
MIRLPYRIFNRAEETIPIDKKPTSSEVVGVESPNNQSPAEGEVAKTKIKESEAVGLSIRTKTMLMRMSSSQPSWINLSGDERTRWVGHKSAKTLFPALVWAAAVVVAGLAGTLFLRSTESVEIPSLAEWGPLILVLFGISLAARPLIDYYSTQYAITSGDVYKKTGILSRSVQQIPHRRIQNTTCSQSFFERVLSYGDLKIYTAGSDTHDIVFEDIPKPMELNTILTEEISEVQETNTAT